MIGVTFDFNGTPMVPPGCKIIVHKKPGKHGPWEFHVLPGFYIGIFINGYARII